MLELQCLKLCLHDQVPTGLAIRRENAYMILSFGGGSQDFKTTEDTGLPPGVYCNVLLGDLGCSPVNRVVVAADRKATFTISNRADLPAVAIHIGAKFLQKPPNAAQKASDL